MVSPGSLNMVTNVSRTVVGPAEADPPDPVTTALPTSNAHASRNALWCSRVIASACPDIAFSAYGEHLETASLVYRPRVEEGVASQARNANRGPDWPRIPRRFLDRVRPRTCLLTPNTALSCNRQRGRVRKADRRSALSFSGVCRTSQRALLA